MKLLGQALDVCIVETSFTDSPLYGGDLIFGFVRLRSTLELSDAPFSRSSYGAQSFVKEASE